MPKLEEAADKFDRWMKKWVNDHREKGDFADNKALVSFLNSDSGFQYVKTYDELCQLAEILEQQYDYTTTNRPCSESQFITAIYLAKGSVRGENALESLRMK